MSFSVHPELARVAIRQGVELPFAVWSILADSVRLENLSSHFTKKEAIAIAAKNGLRFTVRHWSRIWAAGQQIFWGSEGNRIYLRSFRRVAWRFEALINDKDLSHQVRDKFIKIQLSGGTEDLRANLYWSWFAQFEEKTISRETIKDLFGLSHDQQRSYEAILGSRLLVKTNYSHIDSRAFKEAPRELPNHHFEIDYERWIETDSKVEIVHAIQYQLPNTFIARSGEHGESPAARASNRAIKAAGTLFGHTDSSFTTRRTYWQKWSQFEKFGSQDGLVRVFYQGKKRLWLSGHFL